MDLSRLPRLSGSAPPPGPPAPPVPAPPPAAIVTPAVSPGSIWVGLLLGILFILLGWNFARWAIAVASGQTFSTGVTWSAGPKSGQPVDYWELQGATAWSDLGMFLFGVAAIVDAVAGWIAARTGSRGTALAALLVGAGATLAATAWNALVCVKLLSIGITPIFSLLAVAVGGFLLLEHYRGLTRPSGLAR